MSDGNAPNPTGDQIGIWICLLFIDFSSNAAYEQLLSQLQQSMAFGEQQTEDYMKECQDFMSKSFDRSF